MSLSSPQSRRLARAARILALAFAAPALHAQSGYFGPRGPEFLVNQTVSFSQYWVRAAASADASLVAFSFNSGQDVFVRLFDAEGNALTSDLKCNPTLNVGNQDEAEVGIATTGNVLVAWSERSGYDGEQMGIFGRVFSAQGVPLGAE